MTVKIGTLWAACAGWNISLVVLCYLQRATLAAWFSEAFAIVMFASAVTVISWFHSRFEGEH